MVGKMVGFFKKAFCHYFAFYARVYGTLKQNLVKFKYTQVNNEEFKPSRSHQITQDANL